MRSGKPGSVCGLVNAPNSFAGYTGMTSFAFMPDAPAVDRLLIYRGDGDWNDRGIEAEVFEERGCTIGPDHAQALEVRRLIAASQARKVWETR